MASLTETTPTRTFTYRAPMDNYEPTREESYGPGEYYAPGTAWSDQTESIVLIDALKRFGHNVNFVIDDGISVRVYYVAAWHEERNRLILHPFPTNPTGAARPDNGRTIDYGNWALGPRKTFHLKVSWNEAPTSTYAQKQVDHVTYHADAAYRLKVIDGNYSRESKWLNITPAQLSAIRDILGWEN